jgi:hypothetical protein
VGAAGTTPSSAPDGRSGQLRGAVALTTTKETSAERRKREEERKGGNMFIWVGIKEEKNRKKEKVKNDVLL